MDTEPQHPLKCWIEPCLKLERQLLKLSGYTSQYILFLLKPVGIQF